MAPQLTKADLVEHLAAGCKPRDQWRCDDKISIAG